MTCDSRHPIDGNEALECSGVHRVGNIFRDEVIHTAIAFGIEWTWNDHEADPSPADAGEAS